MNKYLSLYKKIHIHPLLWVVAALAIATAHFTELLMLLMIVFIHELGHAVAATFFSWRIKKITLLPFGGVVEIDEQSNRPIREEFFVIIFGPLQHVILISAAFFLLMAGLLTEEMFSLFVKYNLMILIFNLFPIWPLDGGKLLLLFLSLKRPFLRAYEQTLIISAIFLSGFVLFSSLVAPFQLNIWLVAAFLSLSLLKGWRQRRYTFLQFLIERYYGQSIGFTSLRRVKTSKNERILNVLEQFYRGYKHLIVIEMHNNEVLSLDENELLHASFSEKQLLKKIGDILYSY